MSSSWRRLSFFCIEFSFRFNTIYYVVSDLQVILFEIGTVPIFMKRNKKTFRAKGKTAPGTHTPILVKQVISRLDPKPGEVVVDCTMGYGGHAEQFMKQIKPDGLLIGLDMDNRELVKTAKRLRKHPCAMSVHNTNFVNIEKVLKKEKVGKADIIFADLGISSMQVDDSSRGISYMADGPLDMRMDKNLKKTGADLLAELSEEELSTALLELSDEPDHAIIAKWIVGQRISQPITTVNQLVRLVLNAKGFSESTWARQQKRAGFNSLHPAALTFQTLRILVNDEINNLKKLLAIVPKVLKPGGRLGIISFHSTEDRLVKNFFRDGYKNNLFTETSYKPVTPSRTEIMKNPRAASAKFRFGTLSSE